jgi:hypothetical protein
VQEGGETITLPQLRHQRGRHTPTRDVREKAAPCKLSQAAIDLLVTHTGMGNTELLGLVNALIRTVRATADGRGRAARARGGRRTRGRDGVCRCRRVGISSPCHS